MREKHKVELSVIVPAYRQARTIEASIRKLKETLDMTRYTYEIVVVVDGIGDKTYQHAKRAMSSKVRVVGYANNKGKGYALRYGMARSAGDIIAFIDSGTDLDPRGLQMLLAHFDWYNADIIVGSKWHPVSIVTYPWWRIILSKGYGLLVRMLFRVRVSDTQLGMKCFRRRVLKDVLPRLLVKKFACDIEMLAVAKRLGYGRIYEAPVVLNWDRENSSISRNIYPAIWDTFVDTLAVFYRLYIVKYYDNASKRRWQYDPDLDFRVNIG